MSFLDLAWKRKSVRNFKYDDVTASDLLEGESGK
jgi:hypothetical protein